MYAINEIFISIQGEGARKGMVCVFVRFAGCNLNCPWCDTDHRKNATMTAEEILEQVRKVSDGRLLPVVFTGGEPALQLDERLLSAFRQDGYLGDLLGVETNGTKQIPGWDGYTAVSPKPGHALEITEADEVRFVLGAGEPIPTVDIDGGTTYISPKFNGERLDEGALRWCISQCLANPTYCLSTQDHKLWRIK